MLEISDLQVEIEGKKILDDIFLEIKPGEIHVLMGPNGSGKSTLAKALMGHPDIGVKRGKIILDGEDITKSPPDERAKKGLFLAFQYPVEVPGVNLANFLRIARNSLLPKEKRIPVFKFRELLRKKLAFLDLEENFMERNLNEGFSGGEKKKTEILQLLVLTPKYAILDETDSGLDIDSLKTVFESFNKILKNEKKMGVLIITHYKKIFDYIKPDFVHVLKNGVICENGKMDIVKKIEKQGYR
ncbi:Fe-S cluster assembly ATPase SufC [Candidatus Dojkabacteria bacterium]|nr:Fe-S cluster assembly ATPase SufC [Candidatus Dojkabacteria bacterium]